MEPWQHRTVPRHSFVGNLDARPGWAKIEAYLPEENLTVATGNLHRWNFIEFAKKKKCNPFTKVKCKCDIKLCLQFRRETPLKIKMELEHHPTEQENHGKSSSKPPLAHVEFWVKLSHHPVLRTSFVAFCQKIQWLPRRRIFWNLNLLCQWLNFKLFGITFWVGKIKFELLLQGPLAKWVKYFWIFWSTLTCPLLTTTSWTKWTSVDLPNPGSLWHGRYPVDLQGADPAEVSQITLVWIGWDFLTVKLGWWILFCHGIC